jgi:hypothetical protein
MYFAFINRYPITYSDTGTYIISGFENTIPGDRPVFYGWFLKISSLQLSFWFSVFFQSAILFFLTIKTFKKLVPDTNKYYFLITHVALVFFTSYSYYASYLTADFFMSVIILCSLHLFILKNNSKSEFVIYSLLMLYALLSHHSYVPIFLLASFIYVILEFVKEKNAQSIFKTLAYIGMILILFFSINLITFKSLENKWAVSKGSHVLIYAKLIDMGVADRVLTEKCEEKKWNLCNYRNKKPMICDYVWAENSPFTDHMQWDIHKAECWEIIGYTLSDFRHLKTILIHTFTNTFTQLFRFDMGDIQQPLSESYPPDYTIQTKLFSDYSLFYRSKQYWGKLNFNTINTIQWILSIITLAGFIWAFAKNIPDMLMRKTILFVSIALFANAFVCAALSDIIDRYQSRIIWIPIMLFLFLILKEKKKFVSMFKQ